MSFLEKLWKISETLNNIVNNIDNIVNIEKINFSLQKEKGII